MNLREYAKIACQLALIEKAASLPNQPHIQTTYPAPSVPVNAVLSFASLRRESASVPLSVLDAGQHLFPTSGRVGIALALKAMEIGEGDEVLLPAFHCLSMVEPIIAMGATPVFYRIDANLDCNLADIESRIGERSKVLMAVHFFGFPQRLDLISALCQKHGLALLEDCSHAFYGEFNGKALGSIGDYAISSPPKCFPLFDGGCLVSARHSLDNIKLESAGLSMQLKAMFRVVERAVQYRRLRPLNVLFAAAIRLKDFFWKLGRQSGDSGTPAAIGPSSAEGGLGFDPAWMHYRMSWPSRVLLAGLSASRVVSGRRRNYEHLAKSLSGLPGTRVVLPTLPEKVVPYMFPFEVDDIERSFPLLKRAGVPIYRWEDVPADTCEVSSRYARHLLQLPCHQELRPEELDWITSKIKTVLNER